MLPTPWGMHSPSLKQKSLFEYMTTSAYAMIFSVLYTKKCYVNTSFCYFIHQKGISVQQKIMLYVKKCPDLETNLLL